MRRERFLLIIVSMVVIFVSGCGYVRKTAGFVFVDVPKAVVWDIPSLVVAGTVEGVGNFLQSSSKIPSPQPGLILPINPSEAVWARCYLCPGNYREINEVFVSSAGGVSFFIPPITSFVIKPPLMGPARSRGSVIRSLATTPLVLPPYPDKYTLIVFYQNFMDKERTSISGDRLIIPARKIELFPFATTGYGFNEHRVYGELIYADVVIKLSEIEPYEERQLVVDITLDPGGFIKDALGLEGGIQ